MTSSLVGSEMCIRDSSCGVASGQKAIQLAPLAMLPQMLFSGLFLPVGNCLLYTSDAADDM
eukprot:11410536-Prorocentrum_lima.AAC.1